MQLALQVGVVGLEAGRLKPQPQAGERRPELMRSVRDEVPLRGHRLGQALGHVVERDRNLALLARADGRGAGVELAALDPARGVRQRPQRSRERAGQDPRQRQPERECDDTDADEDEDVAAHPVADRLDALRHPDGADPPPVVDHGHGREQELLAERLTAALALGGPARQRLANLRPVAIRGQAEPLARGIREQPTSKVDDDHPRAEIAAGVSDESFQARLLVCAAGGRRRDELGLGRGLRPHLRIDPAGEAERERDLERDQHEHQHVGERREQAHAEAHQSSSGPAKRKPTPRTVCT